ncbi:peptide chain release factor N(5)-glutamine methyltransferase [Thalassotalea sp. M1531]|uniref:Release factor glutamine methyltransferase n=1 Tax=Thalassotalea algicola TaxID=2716224 RepID=A0A7Y0Q7P8_9GAMM|nr:peptide chain release factor N(5)-glutamine methyltransferase [Thalassotalea algicola]
MEPTYTIQQTLVSASKKLAELSDSALLDAKVLLAHILGKDLTYLVTWSDKELSNEQLSEFDSLVDKRLSGEPVAYIVGVKEFWSLPFFVAPSTLIPRPDTETLVELVLEHHQNANVSLLDLGTGTGAIALALASEQSSWQIEAVDFNLDAVKLAKRNALNLELTQVKVYQSDWFGAIDEDKSFDVIVSNPPYIDETDNHLSQGDVRFEPKTALVAENEGLADIEHICRYAKSYLAHKGTLYFEHGFEQAHAVRSILQKHGYSEAKTAKDLAGNDRITWAKLFKQ